MKRERSASIAGSVVLVALLLGVFLLGVFTEAENIIDEQPISWSHLALLSFVAFLWMTVLTYRMLPEPEELQEGDSRDV